MRDCRLLDGKLQYPEPLDKLQYRSLHYTVLLCSERVDGVQAGSATRGDGGGGQPAKDESEGRQGDSPGIGRGDTVEEGMKEPVAPESDANSGRSPESHEQQGLAHDHTDDGGAVGAQSHAYADLPGPLFDHVGEQTV
jgi:hypothetical protein